MKKILILVLALGGVFVFTLAFASFDINLKYGSRGDDVIELQDFLQDQGVYSGKVDGRFGLGTRKAVIAFQLANNLKGDGYFGFSSRAKANSILATELKPSTNAEQAERGTTATTTQPLISKISNLPVGCTSTNGFSPTTGQACNSIKPIEPDLCKNVEGSQSSYIPKGMYRETDGNCYQKPIEIYSPEPQIESQPQIKSNVFLNPHYHWGGATPTRRTPFYINKESVFSRVDIVMVFDPPIGNSNSKENIKANCVKSGNWSGNIQAETGYNYTEEIDTSEIRNKYGESFIYSVSCTLSNGYISSDSITIMPAYLFGFDNSSGPYECKRRNGVFESPCYTDVKIKAD